MTNVGVTADQARSIVRSIFPDAELASCEPLPGEHRNQLYDLTLSDASAMMLKVYAVAPGGDSAGREAHLLRTVTAETGVPVPRLLGHGERLPWEDDAHSAVHPWALLSHLPGGPLSQTIGLLEDAELEAVAYELGRYLAHLHQLPLLLFGALLEAGPHAHAREKAYVLSQASEWLQACAVQGLLPPEMATVLRDRFQQTTVLDRQQPCLTHADLSARKVIVEPGHTGHHVTGMVGWGCALGGSPERDIAGLFAWELRPESVARKGLLDGYTESAELPPHFWERMELYEVFASLGVLVGANRTRDTRLLQSAAQRLSRNPDAAPAGERGNSESVACV